MSLPITVEIADREEMNRRACLRLLQAEEGIRVVGEARNGLEALTAAEKLKPDVLLLGINLLKGREISLLSTVRRKSPGTKVILLTRRAAEPRVLKALSYGASGYIEEEAVSTFLLKAVRLVDAGEAWVPRKILSRVIGRLALLIAQQEPGMGPPRAKAPSFYD